MNKDIRAAMLGDHEAAKLTHLSLFSGIGGLDLAAEMAGFRTVGQCEWADYPTKVLEKHWPDVPRWRDIRTLIGESFYEKTGMRTVDVISGGFPCQPFSVAGKRRGKEDDRYLWPEMLRVIRELRPRWIVGENVVGIIGMALDDILFQLEKEGYEARTFVFPAYAVGALHQRNRVAIVAYSCCDGWKNEIKSRKSFNAYQGREEIHKQKGRDICIYSRAEQLDFCKMRQAEWGNPDWLCKSGICRVVDGISNRMDRLVCLGNAVVPQQFHPVFQAIADIERGVVHG